MQVPLDVSRQDMLRHICTVHLKKTSKKVTHFLHCLLCAVLQTPRTKTGIPAILLRVQGTVLHFLGLAHQTLLSFTATSVKDILHHVWGSHWKVSLGFQKTRLGTADYKAAPKGNSVQLLLTKLCLCACIQSASGSLVVYQNWLQGCNAAHSLHQRGKGYAKLVHLHFQKALAKPPPPADTHPPQPPLPPTQHLQPVRL